MPNCPATDWHARTGLLLFVDAVDAAVRASEVAVGVVHVRDPLNIAQELTARRLQFSGRGFDVVDTKPNTMPSFKP